MWKSISNRKFKARKTKFSKCNHYKIKMEMKNQILIHQSTEENSIRLDNFKRLTSNSFKQRPNDINN